MSTVATFEIEYLQYLGQDGRLVREDLPEFAKDRRNLVELFKQMLLVRTFDTKAIALQRTGKLGTYASCLGHEAAHIGIGTSLRLEPVKMDFHYATSFGKGSEHYIRLCYAKSPELLPKAMDRLETFLETYRRTGMAPFKAALYPEEGAQDAA